MSDFTEKTQRFMSSSLGNMSRELAEALIEQFGGEDDFIEKYQNACEGINNGIGGWIDNSELLEFYDSNTKEILAFARLEAKSMGLDSIGSMVKGFTTFDGQYNTDDIAEGLYDKESENHEEITVVMAQYAGEELARAYARFLEAEDEDDDFFEDEDEEDFCEDGYS